MRRFGAVLILVILLAGCSDPAPVPDQAPIAKGSPAAGKELDPCKLPSRAELIAVLGAEPLAPEPDVGVSLRQCSWFDAAGTRYAVVQLLNAVRPDVTDPDGYGWTRKAFDERWKADAKAVRGLGDSAWYLVAEDGGTLFVLNGDFGISVGLVYMDPKNRPAAAAMMAVLKPFAVAISGRG